MVGRGDVRVRADNARDAAVEEMAESLDAARTWSGASAMHSTRAAAWTDDYSDVLSALVAKMR